MGKMEDDSRRRRRMGIIQQAILGTVAVGGIILVAAIAPNALQLLGGPRNKYRFNNQAKTALSRLAQKGYVVFEENNGKRFARITSSGERKLAFEEKKLLLQARIRTRWDKRWRVVIFDIPESRRKIRDRL